MIKLSERRARERAEKQARGREIIERYPLALGEPVVVGADQLPVQKLEACKCRNDEWVIVADDEIIATRYKNRHGPPTTGWITLREGLAVYDTDNRIGIELEVGVISPKTGALIQPGTFCVNEVANALFEKQQGSPSLN